MTEDKFYVPKTKEEVLKETLEYLDEVSFKFALFVDSFKRYLEKLDIIKLEEEVQNLRNKVKNEKRNTL